MASSRKIRVLHVSLGFDVGGQEKLLVEFARHADRERFELSFLALGGRGPVADAIEDLGWPVLTLDQPTGLKPKLVFRLCSIFRDQHVQIVHSHDDNPLLYCGPAAKFARVPCYLHTQHHGKIPQMSRRQEFLVGVMSRFTHRFVCVSKDSAEQMIGQGVPIKKTLVLRNGIDVERFPFQGPELSGPAVCVARLAPEKGLGVLLDAVAQVVRAQPGFRLEIAGDGPCRESLHQKMQDLKLADHVRFLGQVDDVPALLARARLFVLPSFSEGISLTVLEALARGLPVLTTAVGGNPEVIESGVNGLLVPPRDDSALAQSLLALGADDSLCHRLGEAGRRRVETHFDVRRMVARYENLYAEGLGVAVPCT